MELVRGRSEDLPGLRPGGASVRLAKVRLVCILKSVEEGQPGGIVENRRDVVRPGRERPAEAGRPGADVVKGEVLTRKGRSEEHETKNEGEGDDRRRKALFHGEGSSGG